VRTIVYSLLTAVSGIVLLLSYRASAADLAAVDTAPASPSQPAGAAADGASGPATTEPPAATAPVPSTGPGPTAGGLRDGTYTGAASMTRFGPVQVQVTVASGAVTDVNVLQHPDSNGQDQWINARALPILITETTAAQSASIDMVSGATYTSRGYRTSLQSALDQARA
jgi:uncharacterized protein with FMN-binding domain